MMKVIRANSGDRARQSLRLAAEIAQAVDVVRLRRAGNVSRNTWIIEAILEKLAREQNDSAPIQKPGGEYV